MATSRGRSQAVSPAKATSAATSTGSALERDTSQSYRARDGASTESPARLLAQDAAVRALFPARPAGFVTDVAGVVDQATEARITDLAERLKATTGAEIAVVTLPTIGQRDETDVAREIGRAWGVGAAAEVGDPTRNSGAVLLVVPRQNGQPGTGRVRVEVGQGLEGIVTDAPRAASAISWESGWPARTTTARCWAVSRRWPGSSPAASASATRP